MVLDKKFRSPRKWSNDELKKIAPLCKGRVINVSGWKDEDKEGSTYKSYFQGASDYWISNYKAEMRGFQGDKEKEIFLDLEAPLDPKLAESFDVVFNHTVLEHVFDIFKGFENLCKLSSDIVVLVVPFLQEQHGSYGDYWRVSPQGIQKLFKLNGVDLIYLSANDSGDESVYIICVGSKKKASWERITRLPGNIVSEIASVSLGTKIIRNGLRYRLSRFLKRKS
jgi:hypothetical protein